jgi:predicted transcriptional regulator
MKTYIKGKGRDVLMKSRKNRSSIDIVANILEIAKDGAKKTRIMYLANLSYELFKKYLNFSMDKNFLEYNSIEKKYKTTNKGLDFLKNYYKFKKIEEKYKKELKAIKEAFMGS